MKFIKSALKIFFVIILLSLLSIFFADYVVENSAEGKTYTSVSEIPHNKVGLLLGTGKILMNGRLNLYYKYRINAAVKLFNSGKINYILVSGDNSTSYYDEPTTIKRDLIKKGIPKDKIYLDYAGFRTFDSVVRSKEIFGQKSITVISQAFHNERAIFIANQKDINAIGFNAKDVGGEGGERTQLREKFARVKVILDILFGKEPKFLGETIEIK